MKQRHLRERVARWQRLDQLVAMLDQLVAMLERCVVMATRVDAKRYGEPAHRADLEDGLVILRERIERECRRVHQDHLDAVGPKLEP